METGTAEPKQIALTFQKAFRNGWERRSAFFWTVLISGAVSPISRLRRKAVARCRNMRL
jgi:hypothetical protein